MRDDSRCLSLCFPVVLKPFYDFVERLSFPLFLPYFEQQVQKNILKPHYIYLLNIQNIIPLFYYYITLLIIPYEIQYYIYYTLYSLFYRPFMEIYEP